MKRFICCHDVRHRGEIAKRAINAVPAYLAVKQKAGAYRTIAQSFLCIAVSRGERSAAKIERKN